MYARASIHGIPPPSTHPTCEFSSMTPGDRVHEYVQSSMDRVPIHGKCHSPKGWEYSTSRVYYNVGCLLPGHSI